MPGSRKNRPSVVRMLSEEESALFGQCPACNQPDVADKWMVQCDSCDEWYHFTCAKVNESIKDKSFSCVKCAPPPAPPSSKSSRSTSSSVRKARRELELQRLAEEKALEEQLLKQQQEEEAALQKIAMEQERKRKEQSRLRMQALQMEYIKKKYNILQATAEEDEDNESVQSHRSNHSLTSTVQDWVNQHHDLALVIGNGTINFPTGITASTGTVLKRTSANSQVTGVTSTPVNVTKTLVRVVPTTTTSVSKSDSSVPWNPLIPFRVHFTPGISLPLQYRTTQDGKVTQHLILPEPDPFKQPPIPVTNAPVSTTTALNTFPLSTRTSSSEPQTGPVPFKQLPIPGMSTPINTSVSTTALNTFPLSTRTSSSEPQTGPVPFKQQPIPGMSTPINTSVSTTAALNISPLTSSQQELLRSMMPPTTSTTETDQLHRQIQDLQEQLNHLMSQGDFQRGVQPTQGTSYSGPSVRGPTVTTLGNTIPFQGRFQQNVPLLTFRQSGNLTSSGLVTTASSMLNPASSSGNFIHPLLQSRVASSIPLGNPVTAPMFPGFPPPPLVQTVPSYPQPIVTPMVSQGAAQALLAAGPTAQQIAARHVVPRELPEFSGDPADWPLFASSYDNSTNMCGYSDAENLMRLQRCLKGNAREAVRCHLLHPSSVPQILATLQTLFGRPELIVKCLLNKVHSTPAPRADKLESLINFGLVVQNLCSHLESLGMEAHLSNPNLLQELVDKLPAGVKLNWALYQRQLPMVDFRAFGDYMSTLVSAASNVTLCTDVLKKPEKARGKEKGFLNAHSVEDDRKSDEKGSKKIVEAPKPCLMCKKVGHRIRDCFSFKGLDLDIRWKTVQQLNLCRRCLTAHGKWPCKAPACGTNGCEVRHHKLLHPGKTEVKSEDQPTTSATVNVHRQLPRKTLFRVVPVILHGKTSSVETLAFLDDGSSLTLVEKELAAELGIKGKVEPLCLQWTGNIRRTEAESQLIRVGISGVHGGKVYGLDGVRTVDNLDLPPQTLQFEEIADRFTYLRGLPVSSYTNAVPRILIGVDNAQLIVTLKKRDRKEYEPVAAKTKLGWTVYGKVEGPDIPQEHRHLHICAKSPDQELHDLVKGFFTLESIGISAVPVIESEDNRRAREILKETTVRTPSGRFETGLLWKFDYVEFPDSRPMAEQRMKCLEKKLSKMPEVYDNVKQQIMEFQAKGYAHKLTEKEVANSDPRRTWYLPLGVVLNPNKPGKVRIVWDAAAKVNGVSLNSMLLTGPDLLTPLLSVLFRFRQREVAITGDIREMFMQMLMRSRDRQSLRFVFRSDPGGKVEVYVMDVAIFGATCSPCSAQYVKNLNAEEWRMQYPRAAIAIQENHYVDDYLDSVDTEEEAVQLAQEVKAVHAKAGFEIRKWLSNSKHVVQQIGDPIPENSKSFIADKTTNSERILGMVWLPEQDLFSFNVKFRNEILPLLDGSKIPTKRETLRVVMSIFDPLGLVAAFVIHGKCLVQDIWRTKTSWDEQIPEQIYDRWQRWVNILHKINAVAIPRCYFPGYEPSSLENVEIHVFVDASETAYAAAAYFRIVDHGTVRCALISSKTKVAPLKALSIPRLELQAAVIGSRLMKSVIEGHTLPIRRRVMWSDSSTVLSWIQSDQRKYGQFVAVRISEILSETNLEDWRHVPSTLNVADEATKWGKGPCFENGSRWFRGPEFLYEDEALWPSKSLPDPDTMEEIRPLYAHHREAPEPLFAYDRFSRIESLQRSIAFALRFITKCRKRFHTELPDQLILSRDEQQNAETTLWRSIQLETYPDEILTIRKNGSLPTEQRVKLEKSSPLRKLSPVLDNEGILRVDGRIAAAPGVSEATKFPVILPKSHYVTQLLVESYHRRYGHANGETVTNEIRQKFFIPALRSIVRKVARQCTWCKVYRAVPLNPRMAPLPAVRVTPYVRPFTFVGVDYCGPYLIRIGRSSVKRWVMLFTCLTVRAVHLEVASTLSTESCKMAIRRFIARRGAPRDIYSDQGMNFVGASRELKNEIGSINRSLAGVFTNCDTQWHFNPPAAPHMGGVWERMVRSVKAALETISTSRKPDEETFRTYLAEAESIVNSRPLTYVPLDSQEEEALTPNHFLLLSSSGVVQPVKMSTDSGRALRSNWNHVQYLLDQFWTKWIKAYLPTINRRTKWFNDIKPVAPGDLVIIADEGLRNSWIRGKVLEVHRGKDGRIRSAEVKTARGILQRPVARLAVLDVLRSGMAEEDIQQYGAGNVGDKEHLAVTTSLANRPTD